MSNRKLVITADDFGFDPATNRTILDLLSKGQVTATTVMAVSPFAGDGAESLADYGNGLGLHFILNSDQGREPWLPASDEMAEIFEQYPFSPAQAEAGATPAAVTAELDAQYAAMDDLGLNPTRLDSHSGTLYGLHGKPFIGEALQFCAAKGLGFRMPRSLRMYFGENVPAPIREMHAQAVQVADQLGVPLPEEMASNQVAPKDIPDYESLRDSYIAMLSEFPEGTSELFLHPSEDTEWARDRFGEGWTKRVWEARLLRDPVWHQALENSGIELVDRW